MQTDTRLGISRPHFGAARTSCERTARVVKDLNFPVAKGKFQARLEPTEFGLAAGGHSHAGQKINNCRALNV